MMGIAVLDCAREQLITPAVPLLQLNRIRRQDMLLRISSVHEISGPPVKHQAGVDTEQQTGRQTIQPIIGPMPDCYLGDLGRKAGVELVAADVAFDLVQGSRRVFC
jgi:hypothetical protein